MVFEGMHERICRFNSKERVICKFEVDFKNSFLLAFNPSNGNIISDLEKRAAHPYQESSRGHVAEKSTQTKKFKLVDTVFTS